jgi:hypothetical protein
MAKFGHPRLYNPWQSDEYSTLMALSNSLMDRTNEYVERARFLVEENRTVHAQMRDCLLTPAEQVARLEALDEVGAPQ